MLYRASHARPYTYTTLQYLMYNEKSALYNSVHADGILVHEKCLKQHSHCAQIRSFVLCRAPVVIKAPSLAHRQQGPASQSPRAEIKEEVFTLQRLIPPVPTPCQ